MDATTYKDKEFIRQAGQVVPVLVNAEKEGKAVAAKYGVTGFPTILFLTPNGKVVYKMTGYLPPKPFIGEIHFAVDTDRNLSAYEAKFKEHPNSVPMMEKLAMTYAKLDKGDQALPLIERAENLDPKAKGGELSMAFYSMGNYYQGKGSNDKAAEMFEKTLRTTGDDFIRADSSFSLGQCYAAMGQKERAAAVLKDLQKQPNAPDYYKTLAGGFLKNLQAH